MSGEDRLELRQLVLDLAPAMLAFHPIVNHARLQRPRTIQRVEHNQVFEAIGFRLPQQLAHPGALELEDPEGGAVLKYPVGLRVVERNVVDVEVDPLGPLDLLQAVVDERERAQPEEIHLQEADPFDLLHVPLRGEFVALAPCRAARSR